MADTLSLSSLYHVSLWTGSSSSCTFQRLFDNYYLLIYVSQQFLPKSTRVSVYWHSPSLNHPDQLIAISILSILLVSISPCSEILQVLSLDVDANRIFTGTFALCILNAIPTSTLRHIRRLRRNLLAPRPKPWEYIRPSTSADRLTDVRPGRYDAEGTLLSRPCIVVAPQCLESGGFGSHQAFCS